MLHRWCAAGLGSAALSALDAIEQVRCGELVRVLPEWRIGSYDIWALTARRDAQPSEVKHAIERLQDYLLPAPGVRT